MKSLSKPNSQSSRKIPAKNRTQHTFKAIPEVKIPRSSSSKFETIPNSREHDVDTELKRLALSKPVCN